MTTVVFPGTFDPIHYGHINIAKRAADLFDEVIVAVYAREQANILFSPEERLALVEESFKTVGNISVTAYTGLTVKFVKDIGARAMIRGLRVFSDFEYAETIHTVPIQSLKKVLRIHPSPYLFEKHQSVRIHNF